MQIWQEQVCHRPVDVTACDHAQSTCRRNQPKPCTRMCQSAYVREALCMRLSQTLDLALHWAFCGPAKLCRPSSISPCSCCCACCRSSSCHWSCWSFSVDCCDFIFVCTACCLLIKACRNLAYCRQANSTSEPLTRLAAPEHAPALRPLPCTLVQGSCGGLHAEWSEAHQAEFGLDCCCNSVAMQIMCRADDGNALHRRAKLRSYSLAAMLERS